MARLDRMDGSSENLMGIVSSQLDQIERIFPNFVRQPITLVKASPIKTTIKTCTIPENKIVKIQSHDGFIIVMDGLTASHSLTMCPVFTEFKGGKRYSKYSSVSLNWWDFICII